MIDPNDCKHEIVQANFDLEIAKIKHHNIVNHITASTSISRLQETCQECGVMVIGSFPNIGENK